MALNTKIIVVIPARYDSTRFPGKVLAKETGKYLIQHTYEQACKAKLPQKVIIAADDEKIIQAARSFGADCVMTSKDCASGTDRIAQAATDIDTDIIINVQADEPEIDPENIDILARLLIDNPESPMATLLAEFESAEQISNPNIVKVITNIENRASSIEARRAIYFSRSAIPYDREKSGIGDKSNYLRHLGIYAYRKEFLLNITKLPQSPLEKIEKLEQLRVIENGYSILAAKVKHTCDGIDTPQQHKEFVKRYREHGGDE
ncbi:MAG: 3-deoxy-manno-octulosonate cytidylyltransferase [Phycisphaerae bacterium]